MYCNPLIIKIKIHNKQNPDSATTHSKHSKGLPSSTNLLPACFLSSWSWKGITPKLTGATVCHLWLSCLVVSVSTCTNLVDLLIYSIFPGMLAPARCGAYAQLKGKSRRGKITVALLSRQCSSRRPESPRRLFFQRSQPSTARCVPLDTTSTLHNSLANYNHTRLWKNPWPLGGSVAGSKPERETKGERRRRRRRRARNWSTIWDN